MKFSSSFLVSITRITGSDSFFASYFRLLYSAFSVICPQKTAENLLYTNISHVRVICIDRHV